MLGQYAACWGDDEAGEGSGAGCDAVRVWRWWLSMAVKNVGVGDVAPTCHGRIAPSLAMIQSSTCNGDVFRSVMSQLMLFWYLQSMRPRAAVTVR